jgi:hypothetical protein|tara:strand:- start:793 stop:1137 length:345 start_codon:yes stop_codon:yes gene_type:complete
MADLHRHSVQEALNSEASAVYSVNSALTIGSSATAVDVSAFHIVHVQTTEDIYVHFNTSNTESNLSTSNDLYLMGGDTIYSLRIPMGLGNPGGSIYLLMERKGSSDSTVRLVKG